MALAAVAATGLSLVPAVPVHAEAPPVFHGRFLVRYHPIWCKRAPCPRGSYMIEAAGKRLGAAKTVEVSPKTPPDRRRFIERFAWGNEPLAVAGDVWLPADRPAVIIRADRAIEGEWKP
jgi:hypothetical protein